MCTFNWPKGLQEQVMKALVELALSIYEQTTTGDTVSPMVQKAMQKHREEQEEAASQDIISMLRRIETAKTDGRANIRKLKSSLKMEKTRLDKLDRMWAYAQETANFVPLLAFFGELNARDLPDPKDFEELSKVPDDWEPTKSE